MAFGGGYGAGTLGSLAFGGAQTNNLSGYNTTARRRQPGTSENHPYNLEHDDPNWRPEFFPGTNKPRPSTYPPGYGDYNDGRNYQSSPAMIPWPAPAPVPGTGPKKGGRGR